MKFTKVIIICVAVICLSTVSESRSIVKRSNNNIIYENCIKVAEKKDADCYADIPWLSDEMSNDVKMTMHDACKKIFDKDEQECVKAHLASQKYER